MGSPVTFAQLRKLHVHPFFVVGVSHASVNTEVLAAGKKLVSEFMQGPGTDVKAFEAVPLVKIVMPVPSPVRSRRTRKRPRSRRILTLEERQIKVDEEKKT